ncbi:MAG: hypothetical protein E2602_20440 [Achromobacter sp.]|nr:hypothetical protein [Achromobacter sp.]
MQKIEGQELRMALDKGNAHFHDRHLRDCAFDNCGLSMVKHPQRMSRVQNVRLSNCRVAHWNFTKHSLKPFLYSPVRLVSLAYHHLVYSASL